MESAGSVYGNGAFDVAAAKPAQRHAVKSCLLPQSSARITNKQPVEVFGGKIGILSAFHR
ncbi:hypothetical protein ACFOQM_15405 [Paenibacillus sp. GCM10012307]|uniref:Uncharacterized protein n=1 Tax=Paenibacillus roseus TaxID=2798579 RepID=A0A934MR81_9BACL|nr:hypothetical protein [Paenibacillus roseus]MBJ6362633.1 hypothetical protein [Paenibacillus roseus]